MIKNRLDTLFGPFGVSVGTALIIGGLYIIIFYSWLGIILMVIGTFLGFSYTSTFIDIGKRRILYSQNLFGLIPIGKWIPVCNNMKIGIKKTNNAWRGYSRSNRQLDIVLMDYRLVLLNEQGSIIVELKKTKSLEKAKEERSHLSNLLNIRGALKIRIF